MSSTMGTNDFASKNASTPKRVGIRKSLLLGITVGVTVVISLCVFLFVNLGPTGERSTKSPSKNRSSSEKTSTKQVTSAIETRDTVGQDITNNKLEMQAKEMERRLAEITRKIASLKKMSIGVKDMNTVAEESQNRLKGVKTNLALLREKERNIEVPIPPESPSGKILNQPKSASGIPFAVLQNYQMETGVNPEEIEELMRK